MNITYPLAITLHALAQGHSYGFEIMDVTGLPSGTIYPLLRRLEREGCITARWEDDAVAVREARPRRRYYRISAGGRLVLLAARERFERLDAMVPAR